METRSNNILVGGVVLGLLIALAGFLVWLSGISGAKNKQYDIFFKQSVEGLSEGGTVSFSGVPSGQIRDIKLWKDNPEFVRVRIAVREETPILQGTTAAIQGSFTGPSTIILDGAVKGAPPITDVGPGGVPVIPTRSAGLGALLNSAPQLLERLSTLTERLTELLSDKNQASVASILSNTNRVTGALADRAPEIAAALAETRGTIKEATITAQKIGNLADSVNGQTQPLISDLRGAIASADRSMRTLDTTLKQAQPGVQSFTSQTLPEAGQLVRELRVMADSLTAVAQRLDQEGASGLLGAPALPEYKGKVRR